MRTVTEDAAADAVLGPREAKQEQISLAVDELAMLALGVPFDRPRPARAEVGALLARLDRLAAMLGDGSAPVRGLPPVTGLPDYPRTRAATELLTSAVVAGQVPG